MRKMDILTLCMDKRRCAADRNQSNARMWFDIDTIRLKPAKKDGT